MGRREAEPIACAKSAAAGPVRLPRTLARSQLTPLEKTMKRAALVILGLCLLQGCSRGLGPKADLDEAGPALRTALDAWKNGSSQQDLANQSPSIIMNEDDWREGKRLLDYKMDEAGSMFGRQVVWWVQLKLQDKSSKTEDSRAKYVIDTTPRLVIVRDRFAR
jgi:hypothetical protein